MPNCVVYGSWDGPFSQTLPKFRRSPMRTFGCRVDRHEWTASFLKPCRCLERPVFWRPRATGADLRGMDVTIVNDLFARSYIRSTLVERPSLTNTLSSRPPCRVSSKLIQPFRDKAFHLLAHQLKKSSIAPPRYAATCVCRFNGKASAIAYHSADTRFKGAQLPGLKRSFPHTLVRRHADGLMS